MKKTIFFLLLVVVTLTTKAQVYSTSQAGETPQTLFNYPQAPDTISSFQERANYVVARFWNNLDVSKPVQDEVAFEGAFRDYLGFFPHAHKTIVLNSITDFLNRLQSNKSNYALIGKIAEKCLYSSQAVFASDEAYLPFAEAMMKNKSFSKAQREYYKKQVEKINNNMIGSICPELSVEDLEGEKTKLSNLLGEKITLLYFNDNECSDCVISRLRLSTNVGINKMIADGEIKIICISPKKYSKEWAGEAKSWAENWTIVASDKALDEFDVRIMPSVIVINEKKEIADKNLSVEMLLR